jgi:Domain of unknown function (DUF5615)
VKLLLDENLPHQLRTEIVGHELFTVAYMGWSGIENGELLAKAAQNGFDALISNDRGLKFEQNTAQLPISLVVLLAKANTIEVMRPLFPALHDALRTLRPCTFVKLS